MKEGGWDLKNIKEKERLVLPGQTCEAAIDLIEKHSWFVQQWAPSVISATFWGSGRVNLKFNNCNNQGEVTILVDGTEISKSKSVGVDSTAAFNVEEGTLVEIKVDNRGIIRLIDLQIECGKFIFQGMSTVLILNTKTFDLSSTYHSFDPSKVFPQLLSKPVLPMMIISIMTMNTVLSPLTTMMLQQLEKQLPNVPMTRTVRQLKISGPQESLPSAFASEKRENGPEEGPTF